MSQKSWKESINPYKFSYTLPGINKEVVYRPIGVKQLRALLLIENEEDTGMLENALDNVITSSVIEPEDFSVDDLILQDRYSLMLQIRINSKGGMYEIEGKCPTCGQFKAEIDLRSLPSKPRDLGASHIVKINDEISFYLDHITRREQKEVDAYIAKSLAKELNHLEILQYRIANGESELGIEAQKLQLSLAKKRYVNKMFYSLAKGIKKILFNDEVVENLTLEDQIYALEGIPKEKLEKVTQWFNDNDFGVSFITEVRCPHMKKGKKKQEQCDFTIPFQIPVESFFV